MQEPPRREEVSGGPQDLRTTYIQAPVNEPAGINMDDFVMHDANANKMMPLNNEVDKKRLGEIINEVGQHHTTLIGVISRRTDSVKVIINWWNKAQVGSAINALNM